jgi:hypothetical protein
MGKAFSNGPSIMFGAMLLKFKEALGEHTLPHY